MRTYHGRPLSRATLSVILRNPLCHNDLDIYEFYKSQGTDIYNDAADFAGTNGCYYYQGKGYRGQAQAPARTDAGTGSLRVYPIGAVAEMPEEAACQPHLPARKESPEHMDGGKNQMREMRLCAHVGALNGILYLRCTVHADSKACPTAGA
ncbi:hypothetical protein [Neglectibacter timonensis]|uniref:hypothetical protein n=1 Tax=Neglectibacter timonensis TaxID=1776382 RepID=UPI0039934882